MRGTPLRDVSPWPYLAPPDDDPPEDDMNRLTCPECGGHDVRCVPHPTKVQWHVYECADCGFEGGDHRDQVAMPSGTWRSD
jgi:predicted RNA-binding Zn-ribbon protein involved in translation (DUF1610 family)